MYICAERRKSKILKKVQDGSFAHYWSGKPSDGIEIAQQIVCELHRESEMYTVQIINIDHKFCLK